MNLLAAVNGHPHATRLCIALAAAALAAAALAPAALAAGGARAQDSAEEASIPAVNHGAALRDWEPDEDQGLWVEDAKSRWYYASFTAPCPNLRLATNLSFDTGAADVLDRSSAILVPGGARCQLSSLTSSAGPDTSLDTGAGTGGGGAHANSATGSTTSP